MISPFHWLLRTPGPEGMNDWAQHCGSARTILLGWLHSGTSESPASPLSFFSLWGRVLSSGLQFRTSRCACGSQRASPPALSYSLWLGVWTPSRLLLLVQGHGKRTAPIATFLSSTSREKQLLQWQAGCFASSLLLQEPSPQVCLKWNFKASTFCLVSLSRPLICGPHGLGAIT